MKRVASILAWRKTVAGKTALGAAVPLLVVCALFAWRDVTTRREERLARAERSHGHHATMFQELLRESVHAESRHDVRGLALAVMRAESYSDVSIADWRGVVRWSHDASRIGTTLDIRRPECTTCHQGADPPRSFDARTVILGEGGQRFMRTVVPLRNEPDCGRCHDRDRPVLGMALFDASIERLDAEVARITRETLGTAGVLLLVAALAIFLVQRRLVVTPVARLIARARAVERGELSVSTVSELRSDDELGQLSSAFERMVARIAEAQEILEDKVRVRSAALTKMGAELEILHTALMRVERLTTMGELAATIAHEVRTPLNALGINIQLLKREIRAHTDGASAAGVARVREIVVIIEAEIQRISRAIEEVLAVARVPPPDMHALDLNAMGRQVVEILAAQARRDQVDLSLAVLPQPVIVRGDEDRLRQVLLNLTLNAMQALPAGGEVVISSDAEHGEAVLRVRDNGPGISEGVLASMFKPFVTTKAQGTGLGLAIAARVLKAHGGTIRGVNLESGGALFEVRLPLEREAEVAGGGD